MGERKRNRERGGLKGGKGVVVRLCRPIMKGLLDGRQENGAMKLGLPWPRYRDRPLGRNEKDQEEEEKEEVIVDE